MVRVLIIEDDMILALSLEIMLKKLGFTNIKKTYSGEEALEVMVDFEPDFLLVDIYLGAGISGIELVQKIQAQKNIPVVYITGNSDDYHKNLAGQTNHIEYLIKPVTLTELKNVLEGENILV